jgi:DMSO/TMAO reductase YedYZ molybdopterin-dependent catalytic subunit
MAYYKGRYMSEAPEYTAQQDSILRSAWRALGPALLASIAASIIELIVRQIAGVVTLSEILGELLIRTIPLSLFAFFLNRFGGDAKHIYLAGVVLAIILITTFCGSLVWGIRKWCVQRGWLRENNTLTGIEQLALVVVFFVLDALIVVPLLGGGIAGTASSTGAGSLLIAHLIYSGTFIILFSLLLNWQGSRSTNSLQPADPSRRAFAQYVALGAGVILVGGAGVLTWLLTSVRQSAAQVRSGFGSTPPRLVPPPTPTYGDWTTVPNQTPELTATNNFYVVSKNFLSDPEVNAASWQLEITGLVDHPLKLTYSELTALPMVTRAHTLECISNEVGQNLMSTAIWTGVRLKDLLAQAGVQSQASTMVFRAVDGYSDRLTLAQAMDDRTLLAHHINGAPLPSKHGFPVRLLVPDLYGMKNGKWLQQLELIAGDYTGYWEQEGWSHEAHVKTTSRIDTPQDGDILQARPQFIAGVAYAGARGIGRVEVSVDGGHTWQVATLKRPLNELTWVLWEYHWSPQSGNYLIVVRGIDKQGDYQIAEIEPTLPNGATGYHSAAVTVV